ncbi:MAG: chemotaxis protein CheX [Chitinivibrionia bacterium]|jgi:chemotaxis protein CheX|nr:chemotaxis protein CheX [Chitinivibrionia bacterium]
MEVALINPFINATIGTYKLMLFDDALKPAAPFIKKQPYPHYDISTTIGLSGKATGMISIAYSIDVAVKTISAMVGTQVDKDGADLGDGIGEIVNIVAGYAKKDLTQYALEISLPSVIKGDHFVVTPSGVPCIVVPFESKYGKFTMEVALVTKK